MSPSPPDSAAAALCLTLMGRVADRWQVRIELDAGVRLASLTVALVAESGRLLGPVVVVPPSTGGSRVAELRGPPCLPPGTFVTATAETVEGFTIQVSRSADPRHGLHAFLHADGRLPLESNPVGASLSQREISRLASRFPWVRGGCQEAKSEPHGGSSDLVDMLRDEFGVDPDDLDEDLLAALRR